MEGFPSAAARRLVATTPTTSLAPCGFPTSYGQAFFSRVETTQHATYLPREGSLLHGQAFSYHYSVHAYPGRVSYCIRSGVFSSVKTFQHVAHLPRGRVPYSMVRRSISTTPTASNSSTRGSLTLDGFPTAYGQAFLLQRQTTSTRGSATSGEVPYSMVRRSPNLTAPTKKRQDSRALSDKPYMKRKRQQCNQTPPGSLTLEGFPTMVRRFLPLPSPPLP